MRNPEPTFFPASIAHTPSDTHPAEALFCPKRATKPRKNEAAMMRAAAELIAQGRRNAALG
jgi:hypothetical protein